MPDIFLMVWFDSGEHWHLHSHVIFGRHSWCHPAVYLLKVVVKRFLGSEYRDNKPVKEERTQFNTPIPKTGLRYCPADPNTPFQTHRILKPQLQVNRQSTFLSSAARQTLHDKHFALSQRLSLRLNVLAMQPFPPHWSLFSVRLLLCVKSFLTSSTKMFGLLLLIFH